MWSKIVSLKKGNAIILVNIAKYMCIIHVNYNAKELKLVTTLVTTQPQKIARGKVVLVEKKLHDDMTTDTLPRCAIET